MSHDANLKVRLLDVAAEEAGQRLDNFLLRHASGVPKTRVYRAIRKGELSVAEISHYIALDRPLDCAGSFKWESLGITLFESMHTDDPTALEGLPLIALSELLRQADLSLPLAAQSG